MEVNNYISKIETATLEGLNDPLVAFAELKSIEDSLKRAMASVKDVAMDEAKKYDKSFSHNGLSFERRNGRRSYDFSEVEQVVSAKNKLKELEEMSKMSLSAGNSGGYLVDSDGVEVLPPKVKYAADVLVLKNK